MEPLTPRRFLERSFLAEMLARPRQLLAYVDVISGEDFYDPAHSFLFEELAAMVTEALATVPMWVRYAHETPGREVTVYEVRTSEITASELDDPEHEVMKVDVLRSSPDHAEAARAIVVERTTDDIDFWRDVIGDDLVVDGVVYNGTTYRSDGEGGVERRSDEEIEEIYREREVEDRQQIDEANAVPGVSPLDLVTRIHASADPRARVVTGPYVITLVQTAMPAGRSSPTEYAKRIVEASLRRAADVAGHRTAQIAATAPDLAVMLIAVTQALQEVEAAIQRYRQASPHPFGDLIRTPPVQVSDPMNDQEITALLQSMPTRTDIKTAATGVLAHVLSDPTALTTHYRSMTAADLPTAEQAAAFTAVLSCHDRHLPIDPVLVALEQQRLEALGGQPGLAVEELARLGSDERVASPAWATDILLRTSVARTAADAAARVREVAQHPGISFEEAFTEITQAYQGVRTVVHRMSNADWLTSTVAAGMTDKATTTGDLNRLRQQSTALRDRLLGPATPMVAVAEEMPAAESAPLVDEPTAHGADTAF